MTKETEEEEEEEEEGDDERDRRRRDRLNKYQSKHRRTGDKGTRRYYPSVQTNKGRKTKVGIN